MSHPADAALVMRGVDKTFQLKPGFTIRQALANRRLRDDPTAMVPALRDIDLVVARGTGLALMGANGSGKSTLLKLVSGVMRPDRGTVLVRGRVAGLIDVGAGLHPELTCEENIYLNAAILGMRRPEVVSRFDEIVDFAGIERFLDTQVRFLSSGMFNRLGFSVALHSDPDLLLIDETLSVGDGQFKRKCRRTLQARRKATGLTLVIVAHELGLLRALCTEAVVLDAGRVTYRGDLAGAEGMLDED